MPRTIIVLRPRDDLAHIGVKESQDKHHAGHSMHVAVLSLQMVNGL